MDESRLDAPLLPAVQPATIKPPAAERASPSSPAIYEEAPPPVDPRDATKRRRRLRLLLGLAVVIVGAIAVAIWLLAPTRVSVITPSRGPAVQAVYATGSVEAPVTIPLAGRVTARLVQLYVDEGDTVKQGQIVARFEDEDLQETMRQAQAQEVYAKQQFDRIAKLVESGTSTRSDYDKAYSDWQAARSLTQHAAAEVAFLQLAAPADGRVIRRDGEIGQLIPANQTVLWIARNDPLRITSDVDEEDVSLVQVGQNVLIRADAFPGKIFNGRVQAITPMGDATARTYRVRIEFTGDAPPLMIGMTAETNIIISEHKDALLLPSTALDGDVVWRVVDGRLEKTPVTVGIKGTDKVEIVKGIAADDEIVATPGTSLSAGMRVRSAPVATP